MSREEGRIWTISIDAPPRARPRRGRRVARRSGGCASQTAAWPTRPLRWLVGYPPGGATDVVVRLLANAMGPQFQQPIVVDNRPGAGASVAAEALAKSPPDGATAMSVDMGVMVYNRALYKRLPYDPVREIAPVALYARSPSCSPSTRACRRATPASSWRCARRGPGRSPWRRSASARRTTSGSSASAGASGSK